LKSIGGGKGSFEKKEEEFEGERSRSRIQRRGRKIEILGEFGKNLGRFMKELRKKEEFW